MNILVWVDGKGVVRRESSEEPLTVKPGLSFSFDSLYYEEPTNNMFIVSAGERVSLNDAQKSECLSYVGNHVFSTINHYVDTSGAYKGTAYEDGFLEVAGPPPEGGNYYWESNAWAYVLGADASGKYLGNVNISDCVFLVDSAPTDDFKRWDNELRSWVETRTLEEVIAHSVRDIDTAAGKARAKYVSDGDLTAWEYKEALAQATLYLEDTAAPIPPMVSSGAAFEKVDVVTAASNIVAANKKYTEVLEDIRLIRLTGKASVSSGETDMNIISSLTSQIISSLGSV